MFFMIKWIFRLLILAGMIWLGQYLFDFELKEKSLIITWHPSPKSVAEMGEEVGKSVDEVLEGMKMVREKKGRFLTLSPQDVEEDIRQEDQRRLQEIVEGKNR